MNRPKHIDLSRRITVSYFGFWGQDRFSVWFGFVCAVLLSMCI